MHNALLEKGATAKPLLEQWLIAIMKWIVADWRNYVTVFAVLGFVVVVSYLIMKYRKEAAFRASFDEKPLPRSVDEKYLEAQQIVVTQKILSNRSNTDDCEDRVKLAQKALTDAQQALKQSKAREAMSEKSAKTCGYSVPEVE